MIIQNPTDILVDGKVPQNLLDIVKSILVNRIKLDAMYKIQSIIDKEAIRIFKPKHAYKSVRMGYEIGDGITSLKDNLHNADDEMIDKILDYRKKEFSKVGYVAEREGCCPVLELSANVMVYETSLIDAMSEYTGVKPKNVPTTKRKQFIELMIGYLTSLNDELTK